jgi:hypothetical protein
MMATDVYERFSPLARLSSFEETWLMKVAKKSNSAYTEVCITRCQ